MGSIRQICIVICESVFIKMIKKQILHWSVRVPSSCRSVQGDGGDDYLDVRDQVILLESFLKEKKDELKRLEAVDDEKNRLFATVVSLGLTVDDAIEILQRHRSVGNAV